MLRCAAILALAVLLSCMGCGTSSRLPEGTPDGAVPDLFVAGIYPTIGDLDLTTLIHPKTVTDGHLIAANGPSGSGAIAIHFQPAGKLNFNDLYIGGEPLLGLNPSRIVIGRWVHDEGLYQTQIASLTHVKQGGEDIVRLTPESLPLKAGQYHVLVSSLVEDLDGNPIGTHAYHTFWVGSVDAEPPDVVSTMPVRDAGDVPAGPDGADVHITFWEPIAAATLSAFTVYVQDITGAPTVVPAAPGYPRLQSFEDGSVYPSNSHVVIWRALGGLPYSATLRVTVEGQDLPAGGGATDIYWVADINGNPMPESFKFTFETESPPP